MYKALSIHACKHACTSAAVVRKLSYLLHILSDPFNDINGTGPEKLHHEEEDSCKEHRLLHNKKQTEDHVSERQGMLQVGRHGTQGIQEGAILSEPLLSVHA